MSPFRSLRYLKSTFIYISPPPVTPILLQVFAGYKYPALIRVLYRTLCSQLFSPYSLCPLSQSPTASNLLWPSDEVPDPLRVSLLPRSLSRSPRLLSDFSPVLSNLLRVSLLPGSLSDSPNLPDSCRASLRRGSVLSVAFRSSVSQLPGFSNQFSFVLGLRVISVSQGFQSF